MNFYKHYIGDYQRDTAHLSIVEHGAYRLLLDVFYATEAPLPLDLPVVYRMIRATTMTEKKAVQSVLAQFFAKTARGYVNVRAAQEIGKTEHQRKVNRQIAEAREAKRKVARKQHEQSTTRAAGDDSEPTDQTPWNQRGTKKNASAKPVDNSAKSLIDQDQDNTNRCTNEQPNQTPDSREEKKESNNLFPNCDALTPKQREPARVAEAELVPEMPSAAGEMAAALRRHGVDAMSTHPTLLAWVGDGFTTAQLLEAVELARQKKPPPLRIPANYLDRILRDQAQAQTLPPGGTHHEASTRRRKTGAEILAEGCAGAFDGYDDALA